VIAELATPSERRFAACLPQFAHPPDSAYARQLTFLYGCGVVLTNSTRHQFSTLGTGDFPK
jgi:hypothetical protein